MFSKYRNIVGIIQVVLVYSTAFAFLHGNSIRFNVLCYWLLKYGNSSF